MLRRLR